MQKLKREKTLKSQDENNPDLKSILETYLNTSCSVEENNNSKFEFNYFLSLCKQRQADSTFLVRLLQDLKKCVHLLDPTLFENTLINMIFFDIKWHMFHSNNKELLDRLAEFLIDLNSAYTSLIYKQMAMLIKLFQLADQQEQETNAIDCDGMHKFAHKIIAALVKIAPTSKTNLVKLIDSLYPYMTKDTKVQEAYIKNLLIITEYIQDIRLNIFEICIQKMLKIDVNCTREQIINSEMVSAKSEDENAQMEASEVMKLPLADRLDVMMNKLFEYIRSNSFTTSTSDNKLTLHWETCRSIYKDLLFIFDKYILQTYGSSHVQFLIFFICSYRSMLAEGFLDYLWKRFTNPTSCAVTRQICCYYIGSFLSRAKYIPLNTCIATLQLIVTWIHNYINKTGNNFSNFDLHRTFYALSQTLFYIIIFRQRQLFQEGQSETLDLIKSWKLNEIINSKLNPLLYCLPTVIKKFARITYINQVAYCYSIIDSNNRVSLPTVSSQALSSNSKRMFFSSQNESFNSDGSNSKQVEWKNNNNNKTKKNENPLDSFFPFDPYLLKCSGKHIESIYQEFIDIISDEDSEEETEDEEDDENEDDEEEEDDEMDEDDDDGNEETNKSNDCILRKKPLNNQSHLDDSDIDNSLDGDDF